MTGPTDPIAPRGMFGVHGSGDTSGYGRLARPAPRHDTASRPYGEPFDTVMDALEQALGPLADDAVERVVIHRGELTVHAARDRLPAVLSALRDTDSLRFELCLGVSGVHVPADPGRELHAVYHLSSLTHGRRIRVEVSVPDSDPHVPSSCGIYPTNDWHERETYDFFGILFDGHPSLTRIEMPDDWEGHPQRKDYPLGGIPVQFHGATIPPPDQRRSYS